MDTATVVDIVRESMWIAVLVASPMLLVALGVGLIIGIVQAATSVNEATLSFIPKLIALAVTVVIFGGWQISTLMSFTVRIFERIPSLFLQ
jgi:flagellar biosynthesis protein FliQ